MNDGRFESAKVGQQKNRNYNWGFDANTHAFGKGVTGRSEGVFNCMKQKDQSVVNVVPRKFDNAIYTGNEWASRNINNPSVN